MALTADPGEGGVGAFGAQMGRLAAVFQVLVGEQRADTPFTRVCGQGQLLDVPVSHGEGNYFADAATLVQLEEENRVLFRYCDATGEVTAEANPNGSANNIAGIINEAGNVLGMMPHPERSCEAILGSTDGNLIFESIIENFRQG